MSVRLGQNILVISFAIAWGINFAILPFYRQRKGHFTDNYVKIYHEGEFKRFTNDCLAQVIT